MNKNKIAIVVTEIHRLLDRIRNLESKQTVDTVYQDCKDTSAIKRASMDLTRALATLRKS